MGSKILSTTLFSLFMVGAVDIFIHWYQDFLKKRNMDTHFIQFLVRITFVILAFLFWRAVVGQINIEEFASTHFFFTLFIYCFYRLIASFYRSNRNLF